MHCLHGRCHLGFLHEAGVLFEVNHALALLDHLLQGYVRFVVQLGDQTHADVGILGRPQSTDEDECLELLFRQVPQLEVTARLVDFAGIRNEVVGVIFGRLQALVTAVKDRCRRPEDGFELGDGQLERVVLWFLREDETGVPLVG